LRAVVDERLLRGAPARRISRIALRFERREARLLGRAQTEDLLLAAAVGGVRNGDAIRAGRAGSIERQDRLARTGAAGTASAVRTCKGARAARTRGNSQEDHRLESHRLVVRSITYASMEGEILVRERVPNSLAGA
jgi:hypothetical protein